MSLAIVEGDKELSFSREAVRFNGRRRRRSGRLKITRFSVQSTTNHGGVYRDGGSGLYESLTGLLGVFFLLTGYLNNLDGLL